MKRILLLILISLWFGTKAQTNVYQPWPTDSAMWVLEYYPTLPPPPTDYTETVWLGDTIINGKTYTKVFSKNSLGSSSNFVYTGGVRQDIPNEKLYMIGASGSEYEVFNKQHLVIGDTFPCFLNNAIVSNIDSVLVGTKYHKQYNDTTNFTSLSTVSRYIVGVGPVHDQTDSYYYDILCYSVGATSNLFPCILPTNIGIEQYSVNAKITISPNPTNNQFSIEANSSEKLKVDLCDVNGKHVLSTIVNDKSNIDVSTLNEGVYSVTIKLAERIVNKKLVIVR